MRGGAAPPLIWSYFDVQLLLSFVFISMFSSSSHLFLFRCSAPPLICSYFDVQLLLSFGLISIMRGGAEHRNKNKSEEQLNNEIRTNQRRS
jgi:hypothetical protein